MSVSSSLNSTGVLSSGNLNNSLVSVSGTLNDEIVGVSASNNAQYNVLSSQITSINNTLAGLNLTTVTSTAPGNTAYGVGSGMSLSGTGNIAVGITSGQSVTGNDNVAVGDGAGSNIIGSTNTGLGTRSSSTISGGYNAGSGYESSRQIVGDANTGMGSESSINVTGYYNSGLGFASSTNVLGSGNTAAGASSGQHVTGSANSALGIGSGQNVTGNANIAIGENAGSVGTASVTALSNASATGAANVRTAQSQPGTQAQSQTRRNLQSTSQDDGTPQAVPATNAVNMAVQGDNNVAIGSSAGLGNGSAFSNTVAIGTAASATQSTAVAIGAGAVATAANAVALGAGSIANEINTVSVGAPGAERRITNVAPGVNGSDAATYGQLTTAINATDQHIANVGTVANKGIAMSMAQAGAGGASARPGEMAVAMGTGFFEGQSALGIGIAGASKSGERIFRLASSVSPGLGDLGVQASYQMRLGKASPANLGTAGSAGMAATDEIPFSIWKTLGFTDVLEEPSGGVYKAHLGARTFRIAINKILSDTAPAWMITIDEKQRDGTWRSLDDQMDLHSNHQVSIAMHEALTSLAALAHQ